MEFNSESIAYTCGLRVIVGVAASARQRENVPNAISNRRTEQPAEQWIPNTHAQRAPSDYKVQPRRHLTSHYNHTLHRI